MTAVLQMEWSVVSDDTADFGGRLAYAGLTGGFGTVAIGQQWTPYYGAVDKTDIFSVGGTTANAHYVGGAGGAAPFRTGNALAYVSPNFGGVTVKLAAVMDGATGEDGVDHWNGSVSYDNAGLSVGLGFHEVGGTNVGDTIGLGVKYAMGDFAVVAQYEDANTAAGVKDTKAWALGGTATFGNNVAKLVYGTQEVAGVDSDGWSVGLDHNFSKRTKVFVEYQDSEIGVVGDEQTFGVGIQHAF